MKKVKASPELHRSDRIAWLRAAVLGANDGIVSTASLIVGVTAAHSSHQNILLTGMAGLVAGAMSMASGEYVSVSSQADTEQADISRERSEIASNPDLEHEELAQIYVDRGLSKILAKQVASQLMAYDAIGSHARDELGITERMSARPFQAALASAASFAGGAAMPLLVVVFSPMQNLIYIVFATALLFLVLLGMLSARIGGASLWKAAFRVGFWGWIAMAITAGIGSIFGAAV